MNSLPETIFDVSIGAIAGATMVGVLSVHPTNVLISATCTIVIAVAYEVLR